MADEHLTEESIEYERDDAGAVPDQDDAGEETLEARLQKLKEELKQCEALQKEYLDGWQRARADFINYKKDEDRRHEESSRAVVEDIIHDILVVLDSFYMARQHPMPQNVADGVAMIQAQLEDVLRKRGLEYIPVRPGDELDPEKHESIGEAESKHPSGTIAEEAQRGYIMNGRVLRPARVKLAK